MKTVTLTDAAGFRIQRIKYAVVTSIASKVATLSVQLLAMPIAIRSLAPERFALYAMLAAAMGWLSIANIGIGPGLVVKTATAAASHDRAREVRLFASALIPVLALALTLGITLLLLLNAVPVTALFGENYAGDATTIRAGLSILIVFVLLRAVFSVAEAAQAGHQENHLINLRGAVGGFFSLIAIIAVSWSAPSVIGMILAVNAPLILAQGFNAGWFLRRRPYLLPRLRDFEWQECKSLMVAGVTFMLAGTVGNYLNHQFPVILIGRALDAQATATFAAVMNAFILALGIVTMFALPLWPAIADSLARGEAAWARKAYRKLLVCAMLYALAVGAVLGLLGQAILRVWFGPGVAPSVTLMVTIGVYFVLDAWEYVHYMVLVGLKRIRIPSLLYAARSLLVVFLTPLLIERWRETGAAVALCVSVVLFTAWTLPYLTHLSIRRAGSQM
jgi:O-antigen/teichoic acid export membrane protein